MILFEKPGRSNTQKCLEAAICHLKQAGISTLVVASTFGDTGLKATEMTLDLECRTIVITHNYGFKEQAKLEMTDQVRKKLQDMGAIIHTGTMPFRNIGTAIRQTMGYSQQELIANTLRLMGQGVKVCVEIVMMASDAGLVDASDVIAVAGTGRGADTAAVIRPASSNCLFDLKIRSILAKPFDW